MERLDRLMQPANKADAKPWYRIQNKADDTAQVDIYDDIAWFGVNAMDFRNELKDITAKTIELHINSRGGSVYDALAIMNSLRQHDAKVVTTIDGVAASSAGFIAVGASDELIMAPNSEIMAHLPWVMVVGDARDLRKSAEDLDRIAKNIASIFADKAGGDVAQWMSVLTEETWWSADEAVEAGIADRVLDKKSGDGKAAKNRLDLSIFNHAGRSHAPAPHIPQAHTETPPIPEAEKEKEPNMGTLSESALQKLGLDADADDSAIEAAVNSLAEKAAAPVDSAPPAEPTPDQIAGVAAKFGLTVVDKGQHDQLVADAAAGREARAQQINEANEATVQNALTKGQISPENADTWRESLAENRERAVKLLATIPENRAVPVYEIGHGVTREDSPQDQDKLDMFALVTGREFGKDL